MESVLSKIHSPATYSHWSHLGQTFQIFFNEIFFSVILLESVPTLKSQVFCKQILLQEIQVNGPKWHFACLQNIFISFFLRTMQTGFFKAYFRNGVLLGTLSLGLQLLQTDHGLFGWSFFCVFYNHVLVRLQMCHTPFIFGQETEQCSCSLVSQLFISSCSLVIFNKPTLLYVSQLCLTYLQGLCDAVSLFSLFHCVL